MSYDTELADRVRRALSRRCVFEERAMFGGLAFMVRGHMCCGVATDRLMVRVNPEAYEPLLRAPGAGPMDFTGRPLRGFLFVRGAGISKPASLDAWIARAVAFAESRPPKSRTRKARHPAKRRAVRTGKRVAAGRG